MNVLGLVFSLLLILTYSFYACWDKQCASTRLRTTYLGHQKVNRKILNSYQSEIYKNYRSKTSSAQDVEISSKKKDQPNEQTLKRVELNRSCAQINLLPLIQEGKENHRTLYDVVVKLIQTLYPSLCKGGKRVEHRLIEALLSAASREQECFALEKIDLGDPFLQKQYYKMLKGTKHWDLSKKIGYPSLLDYLKIENSKAKICLFHAHLDLLTTLFGAKAAVNLHKELHENNTANVTKDLIETACNQAHQMVTDIELFELLEMGYRHDHPELKKAFVAEDQQSHVILRKNVFLPKS